MIRILTIIALCLISSVISAQQYVQVWGDEFNTPGLPDSTKWGYDTGKISNNELQYYTYKRMENVRVDDTVLIIEARKEKFNGADYTSARIVSRGIGDWKYGKIEISAKVPTGKGTWPALWMMPTYSEYGGWPRSGEIDIMEYIGVEPQNLFYTVHFEGTNGTGHQSYGSGAVKKIANPFNQFIKFTLFWTPDKIEWYANDVKYHTYTKRSDDYRIWPFNKEFYLIFNLAYGGEWGGYAGVDDTKLPHKFLIDYVRVYQLQDGESPFKLDIQSSPHGKVEVSPKLDFYPENTEVTLTAIPDSGYSFKAWTHQSGANPYRFVINTNTKVIPVFYNSKELLSNGEFDKSWNPWAFYVYDYNTIAYSPTINDSAFVVNITKTTGTDWHLGFQESGLSLKKANYKLTFDAWADQSKQLLITVSKNYHDWSAWVTKYQTISTTRKKYELTINMPVVDQNVRLFFGVGKFIGKFHIDNISLTTIEPVTGNLEISIKEDSFSIYPNPSKGSFKVNASGFSAPGEQKLEILSVDGKLLYQTKLTKAETEINTGRLKPGIYFIKVGSEKSIQTKKILIL
ncbi:MAG TPA: family 16 glycosylhydrolase [Draconibacterium sp.]|nr:family 16 glycosylhydrolase [Draconibacterium sp.]